MKKKLTVLATKENPIASGLQPQTASDAGRNVTFAWVRTSNGGTVDAETLLALIRERLVAIEKEKVKLMQMLGEKP